MVFLLPCRLQFGPMFPREILPLIPRIMSPVKIFERTSVGAKVKTVLFYLIGFLGEPPSAIRTFHP